MWTKSRIPKQPMFFWGETAPLKTNSAVQAGQLGRKHPCPTRTTIPVVQHGQRKTRSGCWRGVLPDTRNWRKSYNRREAEVQPRISYAARWYFARPIPSAMKDRTRAFSDTPSFFARTVRAACRLLGTRVTNFPDATPPLLGLGIG